MKFLLSLLLTTGAYTAMASASLTEAPDEPAYGARLEGFSYPYPVKQFALTSQQQSLEMAYMDVVPPQPNGKTVVLMHGKNFCAATWEGTINVLADAGYRVVAIDQIGFCKSSKPTAYQFTFQQLADNTHALLESLNIKQVTLMGHSMGGMLATRYALMYPAQSEQVVLVNPIGLEDWKAKGVPYRSIDEWYQRDLKTNADAIREYQKNTYYSGQWRPEFERWVQMQAGMYRGTGSKQVAWNSALTYDMIMNQPVVYEFPFLTMPVLLLIGEQDNTAPGKDAAAPAVRSQLGNYKQLAPVTAKAIPHSTLIRFANLGHSPHIQAPEQFHQALLKNLLK